MQLRLLLSILPCVVISKPIQWRDGLQNIHPTRRDLLGILGDEFQTDALPAQVTHAFMTSGIDAATSITYKTSLDTTGTLPKTEKDSVTPSVSLTAIPTASASQPLLFKHTGTISETVSPYPTPSIVEAPSTPPGEATEWRVIGISIICITFVATVIMGVTFFDTWWAFLRDVIFRKRRNEGAEDLVPDWEKRTWEHSLAAEDGHRYPTMTSLESLAKGRESDLISRESTSFEQHSQGVDNHVHAEMAIGKRPSTRSAARRNQVA